MRTVKDRDEQTLAIAGALGIFVGVLVVVGLVAWGVQSLTHALDGHEGLIAWPAVALAGMVAFLPLSSR